MEPTQASAEQKPKTDMKAKVAAGVAIAATIIEFGIDFTVDGRGVTSLSIIGDVFHVIGIAAFSVFGIAYFWKQMGIAQKALLAVAIAAYNLHAVLELYVNSTGAIGLDSIRSGSFATGLLAMITLVIVSLAANAIAKKKTQ